MLPVLVRGRRAGSGLLRCCLVAGLLLTGLAAAPSVAEDGEGSARLHLVTFTGPGAARTGSSFEELRTAQDEVLAAVAAPAPVYRWTTALSGVAVELTDQQVEWLRGDPRVEQVEADARHHVAGLRSSPVPGADSSDAPAGRSRVRGGDGVVIGFVDTGLWPEHEAFRETPGLGPAPQDFTGACATTTPGWPVDACRRKVVAARWFVEGFGADRVRSGESLSARDMAGHGTRVASVAAGNPGVTVAAGASRDTFSGTAPLARIAVYKACWTAPDEAQDGCATSDLVAAVDQATRDGVDVLSLAVAPAPRSAMISTLERALLGAAEADVVVVGAAGQRSGHGYAGYPVPWVTTVGGVVSPPRPARLTLTDGPTLDGSGRGRFDLAGRVVVGSRAAAPGTPAEAARSCRAGALDADRVRGAVVVCRRGGTARTEKSREVHRAGGAGMVLVDEVPGRPTADLHAVPTVHLGVRAGRRLAGHLRRSPRTRARLVGMTPAPAPGRVAAWSTSGDPQGAVVKPDLVAPGSRVLAGGPPQAGRWSTFSGTSAATARVAGLAARIRSRHPRWSVARVHSALRTSAAPVSDGSSALRQGAGRLSPARALSPGLAFDLPRGHYRRWMETRLSTRDLNVPSLLTHGHGTFTRQVTNVGARSMYYSSSVSGFRYRDVRVEPAALRLAPGETGTFRILVAPDPGLHRADHGAVEWLGAQGTTVRMPVVLTR